VFSEVLPLLARGEADYGVCIHEGRFTYQRYGLERVEDLGATWEQRTRAPLPLGGILARASLGDELLASLTRAIRASLGLASNFADAQRFVQFVSGFRDQTRLTIGDVRFDIESCRVIRDGS